MLPISDPNRETTKVLVDRDPPRKILIAEVIGTLKFHQPVRGTAYEFDFPEHTVTIGFWNANDGSKYGTPKYDAICSNVSNGPVTGDLAGMDIHQIAKRLFVRASSGSWVMNSESPILKPVSYESVSKILESIDADSIGGFHPRFFSQGKDLTSSLEKLGSHFSKGNRRQNIDYHEFGQLSDSLRIPLFDAQAVAKVIWAPPVNSILNKLGISA